jgi:hypothetical protein
VSKKKCCVFTIVKNERIFLPIWLKYYSKSFAPEDIYVLDHESTDGSVEACQKQYGFQVITLRWEYYDDLWRRQVACRHQLEFLRSYEYVLYSDADEVIIPDPRKYRALKDYISKVKRDRVCCTGYFLLHLKEEERDLDLTQPILGQRRYWYNDATYDKPLLLKEPLEWEDGFHPSSNQAIYRDPDLWLLHLHKMDFDLSWKKHQEVIGFNWNEECVRKGLSWQYRITNLKDFADYFKPQNLEKHQWQTRVNDFWEWVTLRFQAKHKEPWPQWNRKNRQAITRMPKSLIKTQII